MFFKLNRRPYEAIVFASAIVAAIFLSIAGHHGARLTHIAGVGHMGKYLMEDYGAGGHHEKGIEGTDMKGDSTTHEGCAMPGMENMPGMDTTKTMNNMEGMEGMEGIPGMKNGSDIKNMNNMKGMEGIDNMKDMKGMDGMKDMDGMKGMVGKMAHP